MIILIVELDCEISRFDIRFIRYQRNWCCRYQLQRNFTRCL